MAAKKKVKSKGKICSKGKAWAKRTFDTYPCVTMDSEALTRVGWKPYSELKIGEEILTYSKDSEKYQWKPIKKLHFFEKAPIVSLQTPKTRFKIKCTPNHKWVVDKTWTDDEKRSQKYWHKDQLIETKDIKGHINLIVSAPKGVDENENVNLSNFSKHSDDWVERICSMGLAQVEAYLAAAIVYDGHEKSLDSNFRSYGFSQKNKDHGLAVEIAAVLAGYKVTCYGSKKDNPAMTSWHIRKSKFQTCQNVKIIESEEAEDVWCPETENETWVMKQNGAILITGNSAYANMAASKYCKDPNYAKGAKGKKKTKTRRKKKR